jgi:xanthine dehydrogenase YagR molybdenum-binding subunit
MTREHGPRKKLLLPLGLAGGGLPDALGTVERHVPADEPPAWPVNAELQVVGKPATRLDGALKVTGAARYTADVRLPGMLYARLVTSRVAHARIRSIDTSAAEKHAGVRAVHVLEKVLGGARLRDPKKELPSRYPVVRYVGQPIAAVAAVNQAAADEAAALIKVDYEVLPFVVDLDDARRPGAPLVFPAPADQAATAGGGGGPAGVPQEGNVRGPLRGGPLGPPAGDLQQGFAAAEVIVEGTFRTQVQTHCPMETHGVVADWKPEGLTVHASTQGTTTVRDELAVLFKLPKSKIRVITEFMGGGFGAKFGAGNAGLLAVHLSQKAGAPVRLMFDRREEHTSAGNRPSSIQHLRIGAKKNGTLTALHLRCFGTGGVGTGSGASGPAKNMYPVPNLLTEDTDVFTNAGPAAAFRAPGHPQGCFALEQVIDELAEKLGMDPLALRDRIDFDSGELRGKNVDSDARRRERKVGAERIGWARRGRPGEGRGVVKRGMGVAQSIWYRIIDLDSHCEVRIHKDGSVEVLSAVQDIGTGIRTALAQVVAEELGLGPADITVRIGDTAYPAGPPSGGSKTTGSITPAARHAAFAAGQKLLAQVAAPLGLAAGALRFHAGKIEAQNGARHTVPFKTACARMRTEQLSAQASRGEDYGGFEAGHANRRIGIGGYGGVQFAEVAVDTGTGVIHVERVVAVQDCGRPLNPLAIESQVNGGIIQGLSYALYENRVMERAQGYQLNANLESYKIAGAREVPPVEVVILEEYRGKNSTDAGGIGEPATIATAAAIANAAYNALGVRLRELPMTPARVLAALGKVPQGLVPPPRGRRGG